MSESIEILNTRLKDYYGSVETGEANWRVVWSMDQYEDRHGTYEDRTPEGILIREVTETRRVPKYSQWIVDKWVLESLIEVPLGTLEIGKGYSYEPMYGFPHVDKQPLAPIWPALRKLIDGINERVGITTTRYPDPLSDPKTQAEVREQELKDIEACLYGDESPIGDALARGDAIGYTTPTVFKGADAPGEGVS